ncbi:MAG: [protein-PII] uridylyltransferase [Bryobacterales bacterium]|nr:[protein-PII] uridylyltransferase [Bryobacterales bacterium]
MHVSSTSTQMSTAALTERPNDLRAAFHQTGSANLVFSARGEQVDGIVRAAYRQSLEPAYASGLSLLAVGGFGRRELFPHSDIDLLILTTPTDPTPTAKEALSCFLQRIWDSGLRLSHSVRTVKECTELHENNVELSISLLDQRLICGDQALHNSLAAQLPKFFHSQRETITRRLCRLAHQRHNKFHDTIYHLEPNIKETPGGIRDLHLVNWLNQLWNPAEKAPIAGAFEFLGAIRCALHFQSGRDNNLLSFEAQENIAAKGLLGYNSAAGFMRAYFRNARLIHRAALRGMDTYESKDNSLLSGFRDWRSRLSNSEFTVSRDRILFRHPQHIESDPSIVLRLFQFVGRHKLSLHHETERRLEEHLPSIAAYLSGNTVGWPSVHGLLSLPHASVALRAMHDNGILKLLIPEWEQIECYVVRDFHHRYTVDEHTLIAIETIEELARSQDPAFQRFTSLLSEIEDLALLRFALLYHDIGKGEGAETHAKASADLAVAAAARLGMPETQRLLLYTLIEHHLDLSAAMTGRDLDDPETARWLADRVGTVEVLRYLTLLTYADTAAVHPTALSPWRLEQLWRVYRTTYRELTLELQTERITHQSKSISSPERDEFLKGFPVRYLRIHTEAQIRRHLELEQSRKLAGVVIDLQRNGPVYELTVLAKDRLFLFASVAGALASFGLNILKAEAFANQQGTILDTFAFSDPLRTLELNPPEVERLHHVLERVLLGRVDVKSLLKYRPRPAAPSKNSKIPGRVSFDSDASASATLVEVVAQDRPGLLYELASAFSEAGCNIEVVLVDTEAHKALDVFYVTAGGAKLGSALEEPLKQKLLKVCSS